jgi:hypothetical protein
MRTRHEQEGMRARVARLDNECSKATMVSNKVEQKNKKQEQKQQC